MLGATLFLLAAAPAPAQEHKATPAATHDLKPTPKTIMWGYYDSASKPVLKINSGDTVRMRTLLAGTPERLKETFLPAEEIEPALVDIVNTVKDKGPGGHI